MKPSLCCIAAASVLSIAAAGDALGQSPADNLKWFSGCWEMARTNGVVQEQWTAPRAGTLLGVGRTIRRDTVTEYEFLRIYAKGDTLVYDAQPSGQKRTEFKAVPPFANEIDFANPTHDFPQHVIYRHGGADSLHARIEGVVNGQKRVIPFPYRRVPCP